MTRRTPRWPIAAASLALAAGAAPAVPVVVTYVCFLEADNDPIGLDGAEVRWHVEFNTRLGDPPIFGGVVEIVNRPLGLPDVRGPFNDGVLVRIANVSDPGPSGDGEDQLLIVPGQVNLAGLGLDWTIVGSDEGRFGFPGDFFTGDVGTDASLEELEEREDLLKGQFSPGVTDYGETGPVSVSLREGLINIRSNTTGQETTYRTRAARGFYERGPKIYRQPGHASVDAGQTIQLDASAIFRGATTTITWSRNGEPLVNGGDVSGADTLSLTIVNADAQDAGVYTVEVRANGGRANSVPAIVAVVP